MGSEYQAQGIVTRGEFDLLRAMVTKNQARMDSIDVNGTRGVAVLQAQMTELVRDVTALKGEMAERFTVHLKEHDDDIRQRAQARAEDLRSRRAARRWRVTTTIAAAAVLLTLLGLVTDIVLRLHGS